MVGEEHGKRDIIRLNDSTIQCIFETNKSYDALLYPTIFLNDKKRYLVDIKYFDVQQN